MGESPKGLVNNCELHLGLCSKSLSCVRMYFLALEPTLELCAWMPPPTHKHNESLVVATLAHAALLSFQACPKRPQTFNMEVSFGSSRAGAQQSVRMDQPAACRRAWQARAEAGPPYPGNFLADLHGLRGSASEDRRKSAGEVLAKTCGARTPATGH